MGQSSEKSVEEFIDRMGMVAEGDGVPRIAGRILGLMVIEGGPLSFAEIAERLGVSRGSISTNTRFLERLGVLERVARRGERQDYFRLAAAPYVRLLEGSTERMAKAQAVVNRAKAGIPSSKKEAHRRLDELGAFYEGISDSFKTLVKRFSNAE